MIERSLNRVGSTLGISVVGSLMNQAVMRRPRWEVGRGLVSISIHILHSGGDREERVLTLSLILTVLLPFFGDDGSHGFVGFVLEVAVTR
jgi:hypothetical protein